MRSRVLAILTFVVGVLAGSPAQAQIEEDWIVFVDSETDAMCGVVNAANAEFIVLFADGVMVQVSGPDTLFEDLVVADDFSVLFDGEPAGFIEFAEDGDGLPTVFWFTDDNTIVEVEDGVPLDSGLDPIDIVDTGCDACEVIDSSSLCDDGPGNGGSNGGGNGDGFVPIFCGAGALPMALSTMFFLTIMKRRVG
jgi:hypothetical protein